MRVFLITFSILVAGCTAPLKPVSYDQPVAVTSDLRAVVALQAGVVRGSSGTGIVPAGTLFVPTATGPTPHLPPGQGTGRQGPGPRPALPLPRLQRPGPTLPPRPRRRLPPRPHRPGQPAEPVPRPPRLQAPRRLDRHHDPPRHLRLDRPHRPHPHHHTRLRPRPRRLSRRGPSNTGRPPPLASSAETAARATTSALEPGRRTRVSARRWAPRGGAPRHTSGGRRRRRSPG